MARRWLKGPWTETRLARIERRFFTASACLYGLSLAVVSLRLLFGWW